MLYLVQKVFWMYRDYFRAYKTQVIWSKYWESQNLLATVKPNHSHRQELGEPCLVDEPWAPWFTAVSIYLLQSVLSRAWPLMALRMWSRKRDGNRTHHRWKTALNHNMWNINSRLFGVRTISKCKLFVLLSVHIDPQLSIYAVCSRGEGDSQGAMGNTSAVDTAAARDSSENKTEL